MSRPIDRTGIRYGRLVALKRSTKTYGSRNYHPYWECLCDCGKFTIVFGPKLQHGNTTSCGCFRHETNAKNFVGTRAGKLLAIRRITNKGSEPTYECECDCGNKCVVTRKLLFNKQKLSCGCSTSDYRRTAGKIRALKTTLPEGEWAMRSLYQKYRYGASKRELKFDISIEEFREKTQKACSYCGLEPSSVARPTRCNGFYLYNGLDRIDNKVGYTSANTVPSCKRCNRSKSSMPVEEFLEWSNRISNHQQLLALENLNWNIA